MAANEDIGGVSISVGADFSDLDAQFDAAIQKAQQRSGAMASAIQDGVKAPDVTPVTNALDKIGESAQSAGKDIQESLKIEAPALDLSQMAGALSALSEDASAKAAAIADAINSINTDGATSALIRLGESAGITSEDLDQLIKRMDELVQSGAAATQGEALTTALKELGTAADADVEKLDALAAAERDAGNAAGEGGEGQKKFSEGVQSIIEKQAALDENLRQAISTLSEMHDAYTQGSASADALAQAENRVDEALRAASPSLESVKTNVKEVAQETETAADRFAKLGEAMAGLATAFAFTEGLKALGMAALEAADNVDDAGKAIALLGGSAVEAEATIAELRTIASDDALSFPKLLIASQRMTAFTGDASKVPAIMRAAADSAQVMGVGIDTAAKAIERFAAGGDLSAKSLKQLGLTMTDMATVLGTTEEKAKAAFAALDQSGKLDAVVSALGKFKGAAKDASDDALGSLVRMGQQWDQVLEEIGKALDPVLKSLVQFAQANILAPIKAMAEAFNTLPTPVKEFAGGLALAAAAIVPLAGAVAAVSAAIGPLSAVLAPVAAAFISIATESIPAAIAAIGTFATVSLPAAISAASAFATALIADAVASVTTFATVAIPEAIAALGVLVFTTIPAAIAGFGTLATEGITAAATSFTAFAADAVASMIASLTTMATGAIPLAIGALSALGAAAVLAAGAFAGFELGKWLYNNVGFLRSFGDAIAGVIGKLEDWVTQSKIVAQVLAAMGDQQAKNVLSTIELANTTQKLADNLAKHGVVIKQGADSLEVWNEKLVAAAASLGKTGDAAGGLTTKMTLAKAQIDGHAASLETLRSNLDAANDKLINAAAAYEKAKASGQGLQQATENLAKAQAEATKASEALNKPVKDMAESFAKAEASVASFNAKVAAGGTVDQLQKAFENASKAIDTLAKKNLPDAIASVDAYLAAQEHLGAKSTVIMEAFAKESELIQKLAKESLPQASDAMLRLIDTLGKGATPIGVWQKALADEEALLGKLANESLSQAEAGWKKLINELERGNAPASVLTKALQDHTDWLAKVAKASDAAEAAFIKLANAYATINLHGPEANKIFAETHDTLDRLGILLPKLPPPISDINKAMIDAGASTAKAKNAFEDLHTPLSTIITDMGLLVKAAQDSGDWTPVLTALDSFDKRIQSLAKTDLPDAVAQLQALVTAMQNAGAPIELVQGQLDLLGKLVEKMGKEGYPGAKAALDNYLESLKKVPGAIQDVIGKQIELIAKDDALVASLAKQKDAYGAFLEAQAKDYQDKIRLGELQGKNVEAAIYGLEAVKLKQDALRDSTHGMADAYVKAGEDIIKAFDQVAGAIADCIVEGKNFEDAMVNIAKNVAKAILTDLIQGALKPLEKELKNALSDLYELASGGKKTTTPPSGSDSGTDTNPADAASAAKGGGGGAGGGGGGNTADTVMLAIVVAELVLANILLAHISSDTGKMEPVLRALEAETENRRKDAWEQYIQTYLRIGEIKNDLDAIKDILAQGDLSGAGFPEQTQKDITDIAVAARQQYIMMPTILGALSTIAQDIVTWGGYQLEQLYVIVQKLGGILTNVMASPSAEPAASANDLASAATDIVDAIDASTETATGDVSGVADAVADAASVTVDAVSGSSDQITDALSDTSGAVAEAVKATSKAVADLGGTVTTSSDGLARAYKDASPAREIVAAIDTSRDKSIDVLLKQLEAAKQAAASGGSTVDQIKHLQDELAAYQELIAKEAAAGNAAQVKALQQASDAVASQIDSLIKSGQIANDHLAALKKEYALYQELTEKAIREGNLDLAETYRQQAKNVSAEILQVGRDVDNAGQTITAAVTSGASTIGLTVTNSSLVVAGAVATSAVVISNAVSAAVAAVSFKSGGTTQTTGVAPGGGGTPTTGPGSPGYGQSQLPAGPTTSTGGYGGGSTKLSTNAPSAANNGGPSGLPTTTPATSPGTLTFSQPAAGPSSGMESYPHFQTGGEVLETGGAIVDQGEIVSPAKKGDLPKEPDYAGILAQAQQTDQQLILLMDQVASQQTWIAQYTANHAPPAMIALLQAQLEQYQKALTIYEVQMGYAKKTADAVTKPPQPTGGPAHPMPGTSEYPQPAGTSLKPEEIFGSPEWMAAQIKKQAELPTEKPPQPTAGPQHPLPGTQEYPAPTTSGTSLTPVQILGSPEYLDALKKASDAALAAISPSSGGGSFSPGAGTTQELPEQTLGFYAGALAELEDIRTTVHSERDLISSMRDSWVAFQATAHNDSMVVGQAIIDAIGGKEIKPIKSFDLGGAVGMNMIANLHAGEEVLAPDLSASLRRMVSVPGGAFAHPNPASDMGRSGTRIIQINAPITINGAKGGRAAAEEFVEHLRRIVPDSNGFSS